MAKRDNFTGSLGNWSRADFRGTISRFRGVGAHSGVPDDVRFIAGVARIVLQRNAWMTTQEDADKEDMAIFLLSPAIGAESVDAIRVPMLDNGLTAVVSRLWFATPSVISARYSELPNDTDDARIRYVADELGLGTLPAIVYDSRTPNHALRWYPKGLAELEDVEVIALTGNVDQEAVFSTISDLCNECFVTPTGLPSGVSLWQDASRHWPQANAEALIQSHLKASLLGRFPYCTIRHEQLQTAGRTDLEIEEYDALDRSMVIYHCILELKVLRSHRSTGTAVSNAENQNWIQKGVEQAASYRNHKGARWSALCCFDMRQVDEDDTVCFAHVRHEADSVSVELWRWKLYASSEEYREAVCAS